MRTFKLSTFPLVLLDGPASYTALNNDCILLAPPDPKVSLVPLTCLRLTVVHPPTHIFNILTLGTVQISASVLAPMAVHKVLHIKYLDDKQFSVSQEDVAEAIEVFTLPHLFQKDSGQNSGIWFLFFGYNCPYAELFQVN